MVAPIFKSAELQQQFDKEGFVKISLLSDADVVKLKELFAAYFPNPSADFFSSSYENDFELKKEISEAIGKIIAPQLEKTFVNYTWFGSAFLSKGNGSRSEMPMHQDWTIVDETNYVALNIWTPLQDTDNDNGTLEVLKGSHKWHNVLRAPTLPFYYEGYQQQLKEKLTVIPTLATEAVVLNQAVIHYSKANKTNQTRIAITTGIKSKGAPMLFHYWDKNEPGMIEQFKQEDDFLLRFTDFHQAIFKRPQMGESIGKLTFNLRKTNEREVQQLISEREEKKGFVSKLRQWLKS